MEFLKTIKRKSFLSEVSYVVLNVALAIAIMATIRVTGSIWPAIVIVLLSRWRVFAVRMRFWFANIQSDLVSLVVSVAYVVFLYNANMANLPDTQILLFQGILTMLYIGWLLLLKPQSKRKYVALQAGVSIFVGVTAIYVSSYSWVATPVILLMWLIGYSAARHVLSTYDEETHIVLLSLVVGLLFAEAGWIGYHWTIAYRLPIFSDVLLPRASILMVCFSFLAYKAYDSFYHHQKVRMADIIMPLIFCISLTTVLVFAFNSLPTNIIR